MTFKDSVAKGWKLLKILSLYFVIASIVSVIIFRFVPIPFTPLMIVRVGEQLIDGKDIVLKRDWKSLEEISPNMPLAVMASEDQLFSNAF